MTKAQEKRRSSYRKQLALCGFRSWKRANERRAKLIRIKVYGSATEEELSELEKLQKLCDLYVRWKTNDSLGRLTRSLEHQLKRLAIE